MAASSKKRSIRQDLTADVNRKYELLKQYLIDWDLPDWYRGLSTFQLKAVDNLTKSMRDDERQATSFRVAYCLGQLGLWPPVGDEDLKSLMRLSQGNDISFLWFLMESHYKTPDNTDTEYNVNQQLIMSAIAHLDMIPTLRELNRILPTGPSKMEYMQKEKQKIEVIQNKTNMAKPDPPPHRPRPQSPCPYFQHLNRPRLYGKNLTIKRPAHQLKLSGYNQYKDPRYVSPNEANRWFANYRCGSAEPITNSLLKDVINNATLVDGTGRRSTAVCLSAPHLRRLSNKMKELKSKQILCKTHEREEQDKQLAQMKKLVSAKEQCERHFNARANKQRLQYKQVLDKLSKQVDLYRMKCRSERLKKYAGMDVVRVISKECIRQYMVGDCACCNTVEVEKIAAAGTCPDEGPSKALQRARMRRQRGGSCEWHQGNRTKPAQRIPCKERKEIKKSELVKQRSELKRHSDVTVRTSRLKGGGLEDVYSFNKPLEFVHRPRLSSHLVIDNHQYMPNAPLVRTTKWGQDEIRKKSSRSLLRLTQEKPPSEVHQRRRSSTSRRSSTVHRVSLLEDIAEGQPAPPPAQQYEYSKPGVLNDEPKTPTPSQTFFQAPTNHQPYKFNYHKIFAYNISNSSNGTVTTASEKSEGSALESSISKTLLNNLQLSASAVWHRMLNSYQERNDQPDAHWLGSVPLTKENLLKLAGIPVLPYYDCDDKPLMHRMLKSALEYIRKNHHFVLAAMKDSHKLPYLREWIYQRYGKLYSFEDRRKQFQIAEKVLHAFRNMAIELKFPRVKIFGKVDTDGLCYNYAVKKTLYQKQFCLTKLITALLDQARTFWFAINPLMCSGASRSFYSYMPAHSGNIQFYRPWNPRECTKSFQAWQRRQKEKEMALQFDF